MFEKSSKGNQVSITDLAMDRARQTIVWMWQRDWLATPLASITEFGIQSEQFCRRMVTRPHGPGPMVTWNQGGTGDALVLVNGFTGSSGAWPTPWVAELEAHYRVIRIDNRGTGPASRTNGPFTIADMADDIRDVLDACGIERATVLGTSMGGMICQEFAMRHPGRINRLIAVSTIPPAPAFVPSVHGLTLAGSLYSARPKEHEITESRLFEAAQLWLQFSAKSFEPSPEVRRDMGRAALLEPAPAMGALRQARAIYAWQGPMRLRRIVAPTTLVHGLADHVIPVVNVHRIAEQITHADVVEVPGAGHLIPWEAPTVLQKVLGI